MGTSEYDSFEGYRVLKRQYRNDVITSEKTTTNNFDIDKLTLIRVNGLIENSTIESEKKEQNLYQNTLRYLRSQYFKKSNIIYGICDFGDDEGLTIVFGDRVSNGFNNFSNYIISADTSLYKAEYLKQKMQRFTSGGIITGVPYLFDENRQNYITVDSLINSIKNEFALFIIAKPIDEKIINNIKLNILSEKELNYPNIKKSSSIQEQTSRNSGLGLVLNLGNSKGESSTLNLENQDFYAYYLDKMLGSNLQRFVIGEGEGVWETYIYALAKNQSDLENLQSSFISLYENYESESPSIDNIKFYQYDNAYSSLFGSCIPINEDKKNLKSKDAIYSQFSDFSTLLTTSELSKYCMPPSIEHFGFKVKEIPELSVNNDFDSNLEYFRIGKIIEYGRNTERLNCILNKDDFKKHCFISGITGSGKSNTCLTILKELGTPYWVIESSKKEYRNLANLYMDSDGKINDFIVYTLGDGEENPLQFNPFAFVKGASLQQHIDTLKIIISSAFSMYASMPNILEQCLVNIYTNKGWSLSTSSNIYCDSFESSKDYFPTLEDLYFEVIDYVNNRLNYATEQKQNISTALITRIRSLLIGNKGQLLNNNICLNIDDLYNKKVLFELDAITDDEEKAVIIQLILQQLFEYIKSKNQYYDSLKHLLVIEEAHRIFKNVDTASGINPDTSNIISKSVEMLNNMLSEIRAYGEGVLVIDQIPTKVSKDVIKNTNVKIIHRTVSKEDSDYISNSIGMADNNVSYISKLETGHAIIFKEGMGKPIQVKVSKISDNFKKDNIDKEFIKRYFNSNSNGIDLQDPISERVFNDDNLVNALLFEMYKFFIELVSSKDEEEVICAFSDFRDEIIDLCELNFFYIRSNNSVINNIVINLSKRIVLKHVYIKNNPGLQILIKRAMRTIALKNKIDRKDFEDIKKNLVNCMAVTVRNPKNKMISKHFNLETIKAIDILSLDILNDFIRDNFKMLEQKDFIITKDIILRHVKDYFIKKENTSINSIADIIFDIITEGSENIWLTFQQQ